MSPEIRFASLPFLIATASRRAQISACCKIAVLTMGHMLSITSGILSAGTGSLDDYTHGFDTERDK